MSGLLCKPRRLLSMVAFGFGGAALIAATARGAPHGFTGRIHVLQRSLERACGQHRPPVSMARGISPFLAK